MPRPLWGLGRWRRRRRRRIRRRRRSLGGLTGGGGEAPPGARQARSGRAHCCCCCCCCCCLFCWLGLQTLELPFQHPRPHFNLNLAQSRFRCPTPTPPRNTANSRRPRSFHLQITSLAPPSRSPTSTSRCCPMSRQRWCKSRARCSS